MCGRYTLTTEPEVLQQKFNLETLPDDLHPRYNIAPSQILPVIANDSPRTLTLMRWGLIPGWAKEPSIGNKMINARSETVMEKPAFRSALKRRRCLVPADGFFEWQKREDRKVPMYIHLKGQELFALAGLWEVWTDPGGEKVLSYTILTTSANEFIQSLHERMPVILEPEQYALWLSHDELTPGDFEGLFRPYPGEQMAFYEVSRQVNHVANDNPALIEPYNAPNQQSML